MKVNSNRLVSRGLAISSTTFWLAAIVVATSACGGHDDTGDAGSGDSFIAFNSTFAPFRTWTSFEDPGPVDNGMYPPDVLGARTQYINMLPPHGSTEFPIGTVIVEARETGTMHILAGVKRGGGFNPTGAVNWEWFELTEATTPDSYLWRGSAPPAGDTYGVGSNVSCNSCHIECGMDNDYVCSPELQLASF